MNILYVITGLGLGGAEVITVNIANELAARGNKIAIMYLTGDNCHEERIDKRIVVCGLNMRKNIYSFFKTQRKAKYFINYFHPDIVHAQMVHANVFIRLLRLSCKIPSLICTEHSKDIEGRFRMLLYRLTDRLSNLNTNVSQEATAYFIAQKAFSPFKSLTVYNGVDLSQFCTNRNARISVRTEYKIEDNFLFLNVGRLTEAKDQETLIRAFALLAEQNFPVKLMILGEGKERKKLESLIGTLSLEKEVILAGTHENVVDYYNAADCFVMSSIWEGFPMVLIEAMSVELPIITTEPGREAVEDVDYIVPIRDVQLLSDKMAYIYSMNTQERNELGLQNRLKVQKFDLNIICNQWVEIYSKTLNNFN